ncbi:hypothetical protein NL676_037976 [Syzygium grande]|nr:hypothetical protein NL676_037976 [Syzygium grande]
MAASASSPSSSSDSDDGRNVEKYDPAMPHDQSVLQKHVAFFDRNHDGLVYPWETFRGFRSIGAGLPLSTVAAAFINMALSQKTRPLASHGGGTRSPTSDAGRFGLNTYILRSALKTPGRGIRPAPVRSPQFMRRVEEEEGRKFETTLNLPRGLARDPNRLGEIPSLLFPIEVKNIHKAKHGSDSGVYDSEGRFVPSKFEEIFGKHARTHEDALTSDELQEMLKSNRQPKDYRGWLASYTEWKVLYMLCKDKDGLLRKDTVRAVYDGSLFERMEKDRASNKLKD